jgi:hypothetical protein
MFFQPFLTAGVIRDDTLQSLPEGRSVATFDEVNKLVSYQVLDHQVGEHGNPPVKVQMPTLVARGPAIAQVPDVNLAGFSGYPMAERGNLAIKHRTEVDGVPVYEVISGFRKDIPAKLEAATV